jgi:hypothetical protein
MDPNATYLAMFNAMRADDHETARDLAIALRRWFTQGGFYPVQFSKDEMIPYINSVLRRTCYLAMSV